METNQMVIQQIANMKRIIEEQKESEKDKEQLLIKLKAKDEKIRELTKQLQNVKDQSPREMNKHQQNEIAKLRHENDLLNL
jgi:hypothetical protein